MLITNQKQLEKFNTCHRIWQGIPSIEHTKGGRTFVCFYSGETTETFGNYELLIKSDNGKDFSEPVAVVYNGQKSRCFDGTLWIDPLDRLWFMWNLQPENTVWGVICEEPDADELAWGEPFYIGYGVMMNRPTVLSSGEWLFPIAVWKRELNLSIRHESTEKAAAYVYKSVDNGKTFTKMGGADVRDRDFDEHMVLELKTGVLKMLVRTTYGIAAAYSYDRGKNWTKGEDSGYGGPNSRFHIKRLRSGRVLLVNHHNCKGRKNLTALLSDDDGKTFKYSLLLDERDWVSYPDAVEADDGFIYVTYDRERGAYKKSLAEVYADAREILIAKFTEQDIIDGKLNNKDSKLKIVASALGKLNDKDTNPFKIEVQSDCDFADSLVNSGKDDIIAQVFEKHPINCFSKGIDHKRLDTLIDAFEKSDKKDTELLTKIIELVRDGKGGNANNSPIIQTVIDYIKKNLDKEFKVTQMSADIGISVYYLCHLFKSSTGTTVIEYRNELRLTKAKLMLINTDKSISNIAQEVGYSSSAYFTKIFTKFENISPSEYRQLHA